ncbi:MAG: AAA family ATPase [Candidatus Moranbacteria bacterium]|nr:AAA family ATPase [Candidatus Moranbacteria bacterium]
MQKGTKKIIIGLVGEMGSGKDTAADYLENKYGAHLFRFSDPLREALEVFLPKEEVGREDMIWLSNNIRRKYKNGVISDSLRRKFDRVNEGIIVLNGMRIKEDFEFVKSFPNSHVIYVTLDSKARWERIYDRGEKSDDAVSFEKFQEYEKAETEVQIPEIGKKTDFRLENNGSKDDLRLKISEIMGQIRNEA